MILLPIRFPKFTCLKDNKLKNGYYLYPLQGIILGILKSTKNEKRRSQIGFVEISSIKGQSLRAYEERGDDGFDGDNGIDGN